MSIPNNNILYLIVKKSNGKKINKIKNHDQYTS